MMLTELCNYLKNWFVVDMIFGDFVIADNHITYADGTELPLQEGQYFRIQGSIFNDGCHCKTSPDNPPIVTSGDVLQNEAFNGTVWTMAVPQDVIDLASEIEAWRAKYEGADSAALSPFNSESFGGYSYSKSGGNSADAGTSWQSVFGNRLMRYRKI